MAGCCNEMARAHIPQEGRNNDSKITKLKFIISFQICWIFPHRKTSETIERRNREDGNEIRNLSWSFYRESWWPNIQRKSSRSDRIDAWLVCKVYWGRGTICVFSVFCSGCLLAQIFAFLFCERGNMFVVSIANLLNLSFLTGFISHSMYGVAKVVESNRDGKQL